MQALRVVKQWVNQEGWAAAGEANAVGSNGAVLDLRALADVDGRPLTWGGVRGLLANGAGAAYNAGGATAEVVEEEVVRDYALDKLAPTQRAFADRVLTWGRELVVAY